MTQLFRFWYNPETKKRTSMKLVFKGSRADVEIFVTNAINSAKHYNRVLLSEEADKVCFKEEDGTHMVYVLKVRR